MYSLYTTASVASDDARAVGELHARVPEASANRAAAPQHTRLRAFSRPRPLYAIRSMGPGVPATFFVRGKPVPAPPDQEDAAEQASSPELEHSCISADLLFAEVYRVQHDENVSLPSPLGDDIARLNELIRNASVEDILEQSAPTSAARASRQRVVCTRKTSPMSTEEKLAWQNVRNPDDEHPLPDQNAKSLRIKADGQGHERTARFRSRSAGTKVRSRSQHSEGHDLSAGASDAHYRPRTYVSVSMASFDESSYAPVRMTRVGGSTSASFQEGTSASSQPPPYPPRESRRRHRGGLSSGHMVRSVSIGAAEPHADLRFGALHGQGEIGRRLAEEGEAPPSRFPGDHERAWALGGEPQRFGSRMLPGTFSAPRLRLFAACMHACVHVRIRVFYICMHACIYVCVYLCIFACMRACIYASMCTHFTHTHTHTHTGVFSVQEIEAGILRSGNQAPPAAESKLPAGTATRAHPASRRESGARPPPNADINSAWDTSVQPPTAPGPTAKPGGSGTRDVQPPPPPPPRPRAVVAAAGAAVMQSQARSQAAAVASFCERGATSGPEAAAPVREALGRVGVGPWREAPTSATGGGGGNGGDAKTLSRRSNDGPVAGAGGDRAAAMHKVGAAPRSNPWKKTLHGAVSGTGRGVQGGVADSEFPSLTALAAAGSSGLKRGTPLSTRASTVTVAVSDGEKGRAGRGGWAAVVAGQGEQSQAQRARIGVSSALMQSLFASSSGKSSGPGRLEGGEKEPGEGVDGAVAAGREEDAAAEALARLQAFCSCDVICAVFCVTCEMLPCTQYSK